MAKVLSNWKITISRYTPEEIAEDPTTQEYVEIIVSEDKYMWFRDLIDQNHFVIGQKI